MDERLEKQNKISLDKRILEYIKKELKKGFSEELIKNALIRAGHHPIRVEHHFKHIQKQKRKKISSSISLLVLLFLIFLLIFYFQYYDTSKRLNKFIQQGIKLCDEGRYEEAIEKFDNAIRLNATSLRGYAWKGWCYVKQGIYDEAIIELKKAEYQARIFNPDFYNPLFYNILGRAYCEKGDYENGIEQIKIAINANSSNSDFYYSLGDCYLKKGDIEEANKYFKIAKELRQIT